MYLGGSIFIHAYGAYFGVMVGLIASFRNYDTTAEKQGTNSTTDVFSLLGPSVCHQVSILIIAVDRFNIALALLAEFQRSFCDSGRSPQVKNIS